MPYKFWKTRGTPSQVPPGGGPSHIMDLAVGDSLSGPKRQDIKFIGAAYTVVPGDTGFVLISTAAITITLPAASQALKGVYVDVIVGAAGALTVAATAGELVAFNDLAANSIAFSTTSEIIGNAARFLCDGAKWYAMVMLGAETATPVIAT